MENKELETVVKYLNDHFYQGSEEYSLFIGAKPQVIRISEHCAVSLWSCGAIACIEQLLYFISEDDGNWFCNDYIDDRMVYQHYHMIGCTTPMDDTFMRAGLQSPFSIGWIDSFINALTSLKEYVEREGEPMYYDGVTDKDGNKVICGYTL